MRQTTQRVAVDGGDLEVMVQGSGEPVVLIHGGCVADEFVPVAAEPDLEGCQPIWYHRRGYGGSAAASGPPSVGRDAADCRAVLAGLGGERACSEGGSVLRHVARGACFTSTCERQPDAATRVS